MIKNNEMPQKKTEALYLTRTITAIYAKNVIKESCEGVNDEDQWLHI